MRSLACEPIPTRVDASEDRVSQFEDHIGAKLPDDYRDFLTVYSGTWVSGLAPILEPTPFGPNVTIESFYGFMQETYQSCDLRWQCNLAGGAPVAIPIAGGAFGCQAFLICEDNPRLKMSHGSIYYWDCENRSAWPDEMFYQRFSNLAPDIKQYLEYRRSGALPRKADAIADFYKVAESFTLFMESCTPWTKDDDP